MPPFFRMPNGGIWKRAGINRSSRQHLTRAGDPRPIPAQYVGEGASAHRGRLIMEEITKSARSRGRACTDVHHGVLRAPGRGTEGNTCYDRTRGPCPRPFGGHGPTNGPTHAVEDVAGPEMAITLVNGSRFRPPARAVGNAAVLCGRTRSTGEASQDGLSILPWICGGCGPA